MIKCSQKKGTLRGHGEYSERAPKKDRDHLTMADYHAWRASNPQAENPTARLPREMMHYGANVQGHPSKEGSHISSSYNFLKAARI